MKIVTKPTTKSKPPPPRPSKPPTIPTTETIREAPKRPAPPVVVGERPAPPIDLLNLSSSSQPEPPTTKSLPKEPSFDLLGGFESSEPQKIAVTPDLLSDSKPKASALDDIFGAFAQSSSNGSSSANVNSSGLNFAPRTTANMNFDPFGLGGGEASFMTAGDLLQPNKDASPTQQQQQQPQQQQAKPAEQNGKDPFADMSFLASGLNLNWGDTSKSTTPTATAANNNGNSSSVKSPQSTQYSSPTHQYGGFTASASTAAQARSPMDSSQRPDYSRSHFEPKTKPTDAHTPNQSAGGGGDIFADILGQQGYNFATKPQNANRSINAMRKEELVKDMDPDKLRIMEWVSLKT